MKLKKFLSIACASVMVLSLAACASNGGSKTAASVDFEDGKFGFVLMNTDSKAADASVLSVKDMNGSKVLFAENQGSASTKIGVDLTALLGDDVAKLATIDFQLGTSADKFAACSGKVYGFFGEKTNVDLGNFSIYMETKNPMDVSLKVSDLKAGEKNYIVITRLEDLGAKASSMFLDNIVLKDADGNVLKANTDGKFDAPEGYQVDWSQVTGDFIDLDKTYAGDWGLATAITADALAAYTEKGVKVTVNLMLDAGCDNLCYKPCAPDYSVVYTLTDADGALCGGYGEFTGEDCAEGDHKWHLKKDGVFHTTDLADTELTFTLAPETVARLIELGGLSAQVNGVTVSSAMLEQPADTVVADRTAQEEAAAGAGFVDKSELNYVGDWSYTTVAVTPGELADGENTVTVKLVQLSGADYTYWLAKPMTADWGALTVTTDAEINDDGYVVVSESGEYTFTLDAEATAACKEGHGFAFQVMGVAVAKACVGETVVYDNTADDWGAVTQIASAADLLDDGCTVTFNANKVDDADHTYWLIKPMDTNWAAFEYELATEQSFNDDAFIVIDESGVVTLTLSADAVKAIKDGGAAGIGVQFFGVVASQATVNPLEAE